MRATPRLVSAIALAACTLLLSGCVYLRLLELKRQIDRFDQFFGLQTSDGLAIICHSPVLRTGDVRWIGLKPESVKTIGIAERWQVRWIKQLPPGVKEKIEYDIVLELSFADERLTRIKIPERYFAVMPRHFLIGVIRSLGRGKIDKSEKQIDATISAAEIAAARPDLPSIDKLLGRPTEERVDGPDTIVRYRYVPSTTESRAGVFDMQLTFETKSGELLNWQGITPVGKIGVDFAADRK
ncbi:MAG: hypothetical protein ACREH8_01450 [Opitutaceae bacterium]